MDKPEDKLVFDSPYEVLEWLARMIRHGVAHEIQSIRGQEAHDYVSKYCMPEGWGQNIWHTILDDAKKLRKELEEERNHPR